MRGGELTRYGWGGEAVSWVYTPGASSVFNQRGWIWKVGVLSEAGLEWVPPAPRSSGKSLALGHPYAAVAGTDLDLFVSFM